MAAVGGGPLAQGAGWIDGRLLPVRDAGIPILDTGFVRSDLTYDVVSVWDGAFFRLEDHLDRFERNWRRLRLSPPLTREEMRSTLLDMVAQTGLREAYVAMIVTRGVPGPGQRDPRLFANRFYAYVVPYVWIARPELQAAGLHLAIARDTTRIPPDSVDPTVKNFHWADLIRGLYEAYDRDAFTAVLTDGEGHVTEGPGFNLFAWSSGRWRTPELGVFDGMTRRTVLELCDGLGIDVEVGLVDVETVRSAGELFISSTAGGIMPVTTLDGAPVGEGTPGPLTTRIRNAYWAARDDPARRVEIPYPASVSA